MIRSMIFLKDEVLGSLTLGECAMESFETVFLLLISLSVVYWAVVFYRMLLGKLLGLAVRLGRWLFRRPAGKSVSGRYPG
jgi:hypothetical protein